MHLVPESTITMIDDDSISSIDKTFQKEFYDMIKEFDEAGPDTDVSGFGTPGGPKPFYYYSTPVTGRRVLLEEQLRDLPSDEELIQLSASELMRDNQKRMPRRDQIKDLSHSQTPRRRIIKRVLQIQESHFSGVPQSTPRVLQLEASPVPWTLTISDESEDTYQVLSPVLRPESLVRPPLSIHSKPRESPGPTTQQMEPATELEQQEQIPRHDTFQHSEHVVPPAARAPVDDHTTLAGATMIDDSVMRLRDLIAESSEGTVDVARTREELTQHRTQLQLDRFHARSKGWFRMTKEQWVIKFHENWKTQKIKQASMSPTEPPEEHIRQVSKWASRDLSVPTLQDRRWMTGNTWNLDIGEEVMIDILGGRLDAPRGEDDARLYMEEEQAATLFWDDDAAVTEEEADELLYRAYGQRDPSLPLAFDLSPPLEEQLTGSGLVAVRDNSVDMMDEQFLRLCLRALDWDQETNDWFLNNPYFDPNVGENRLFVATLRTDSDISPRRDEEELPRMFATQRPPLVSVSASFRWPDWSTRLHPSEDLEPHQAPPPPPPFPEPYLIQPYTLENLCELNRVEDETTMAVTTTATVPSASSTGTAQLPMARSVSSGDVGGFSLQAIRSLSSDPHVIDSFLKSFRVYSEAGREWELFRTGDCMGLQTAISARPLPLSSVARPSTPTPAVDTVTDTTIVQAITSSAPPQLDLTVAQQEPDTPGPFLALDAPGLDLPIPLELLPPRDPIELRPRRTHSPVVDDDTAPRRRRRRRGRGRRRVPPPAPPEPAAADMAAGPGEPMDITDAGIQPVVEQEEGVTDLPMATVIPEEHKDIDYGSEVEVLRLVSEWPSQHHRVLCFSDLCVPGECGRSEAASLFYCLLKLNAQKRVELWQDDLTGDPDHLFIQGIDSTLEQTLD